MFQTQAPLLGSREIVDPPWPIPLFVDSFLIEALGIDFLQGVTVDKATVDEETRECQDAIIHKIDQVLVPNQNSLVNEISKDTELR